MIKTPLSTVIGGAFWTPGATVINGAKLSFEIVMKKLFATGEQGFVYDPNDLTTLYQDAAGTIPVTAAGQPVGLMKDKSGRNNHASQTVSASRPILQQTPILGNEVVSDTTFNDPSYWLLTGTGWSITGGKAVATNATGSVSRTGLLKPNTTYDFVIRVVREAGSINLPYDGQGPNIQIVSQSGTYTRRLTTSQYINFTAAYGNNFTGTVEFVSAKEVTGYRTDQNYLAFDGADDFLQTNNIDFTMTDKVSLFAGVSNTKLNAVNVLAELSASADTGSNVGSFYFAAPSLTNFRAQARGTNATAIFAAIDASSFNAKPVVLSAKYDLAQRVGIKANSIGAEGQGNAGGKFNNYPLYIGRRGGTQYPFSGNIYSLIIVGRLTTDSETVAIEKALAKNTGVTLNV